MRPITLTVIAFGLAAAPSVHATVYDLKTQWSDAANPNGAWSYREGANALPHVTSWQSALTGFTVAQPGWARSENGNNRIPFFYKSLGNEDFVHDYVAGDIVVHTTDGTNGVGNGLAAFVWTSPDNGTVSIAGGVWMGRDIGRSNDWALLKNGAPITGGAIASGDVYNRASPFNLAAGSGGAASVTNIPIAVGDTISLRFTNTSNSGDFVGANLTLTTIVPEPMTAALAAPAVLALRRKRRH